jgi:hypothetical protein
LIRLYRRLGALRRATRALRSRESFYYWLQSLQGTQLVAYHRHAPAVPPAGEQFALVILNFSAYADTIRLPFPAAGAWTEALDADTRPNPWPIQVQAPGDVQSITVPSNYGYIFVLG